MTIQNINTPISMIHSSSTSDNNASQTGETGFAALLEGQLSEKKEDLHLTSVETPQYTRAPSAAKTNPVVQAFLNYMQKTPEERYIESWLVSHNLTKEELEKMPPEKRAAIIKQMSEDMKRNFEQQAKEKLEKSSVS